MFVGGPPAVLTAATRDRRPTAAQRALLARLDGGLADLAARHRGPGAVLPRDAGAAASSVRARLGAGRGRRLVEGPAVHPRDPAALHDAELLTAAVVGGAATHRAAEATFAGYHEQRDRLALPMHPIVDRLASHEWDLPEARQLLRGLSAVMADEVEAIHSFDPAPARTA